MLRFNYIARVLICLFMIQAMISSCGVSRSVENTGKGKPAWVDQRPTNTQYYIGIGYASKVNNSGDFQRVAKKNALDDMMGEIKVSVSSNSLLSQFQTNQTFTQQFFSDTRMIASETMEGFQVMDSWENKTEYWIYYRMSKADFEAYKRKKIYEASEKALDYMYRADKLNLKEEYVQAFKLRVSAAASLQNYLNESIETEYYGKTVFLLNEILSQLQDQLYMVQLKADQDRLQVISGKSMEYPIVATARLKTKDSTLYPLAYLPLKIMGSNLQFRGNPSSETQLDGSASFAISGIQSKDPMQVLNIKTDIEKLLRGDSLNMSLRKILLGLDGPVANIRLKVEPIKIYMITDELNLNQKLNYPIIEPALKKRLMEKGCTFVSSKEQADYTLEVNANTKDQGVMWGNMLRATIEMNLVLREAKSGNEVMHDGLEGIQGFQTTTEKAGIEAYRNLVTDMMNKVYPQLEASLFNEP